MLTLLRRLIPTAIKRFLLDHHLTGPSLHRMDSYTPEGEDSVLAMFLSDDISIGQIRTPGFYVDIGAHHPMRHSTTYKFYRMGWQGINIEPTTGSLPVFRRVRPRDLTIQVAVTAQPTSITFFTYAEPALNTSLEARRQHLEASGIHPTSSYEIPGRPLKDILDEHLPLGTEITFMNIDVEGCEYSVLLSNDWSKYRPRYLVVEELRTFKGEGDVPGLLASLGYDRVARTYRSSIYRDTRGTL